MAKKPDPFDNVIFIAGPLACSDELADSICRIASRMGNDLNSSALFAIGLGKNSRRQLSAHLDVAARAAESAGFTVLRNVGNPGDDDIDVEVVVRRK